MGQTMLALRTRSLNLAILSSLNCSHEPKLHIRGAVRNGVAREEIREEFIQVAVYCGVPASVQSFRCPREVFAEITADVARVVPASSLDEIRKLLKGSRF